MGATTKYALRYPEQADPADVPTDMHELADDVEAALSGKGPGTELAYAQITVGVSVGLVTEAAAVTVVSAGAVTFDGQPVEIEFFTPAGTTGATAGSQLIVTLWDGSTDLGRLGQVITPAATLFSPLKLGRRLTPTAGSHTFIIKAWAVGQAGTVNANAGGTGLYVPAYIRIVRV